METLTPQPSRAKTFEFTLTGASPDILHAQAARRCAAHFGDCPFRVALEECRVCLATLGGSPRLWSSHVVAHALEAALDEAGLSPDRPQASH